MNDRQNTIKWLWEVPERKKLYILILTILQSLVGASGVIYALLMKNIVDFASAGDKEGFIKNVILIIALVIAQITVRAFIRKLEELSRSTFENIFKKRLLHNIMQKDFGKISAVHSGEWLNRLTNDTVVVANNYTDIIPGLSGMIVKLLSAFVMMIVLDWRFACILVPGGIIMGIMTYAFRKVLKRLHKNMQEKDGKLRIFLQERIASMMIIRSFAAENQIESEAEEKMSAHKDARMKKNSFSNFCNIGFACCNERNVSFRHNILRTRNTCGYSFIWYAYSHNSAYRTDTGTFCKYHRLSAEILYNDRKCGKTYGSRKFQR